MSGCATGSATSAGPAAVPGGRKLLRLEVRNAQTPIERKPEWIKTRAKMGPEYTALHSLVKDEGLHTVCQEAGCPNIYECWEDREATFLIGGSQCTRRCDFCQIDTGKPADYDRDEPRRVAESVVKMRLRYATVTGVARDDLPDEGAWLHAETVRRIHAENPGTGVEILATDFSGNPSLLREVFESRPEVFAHNVETVPRIFKRIRPAFRYERSLDVLTQARDFGLITKSNLILGMGEEPAEVVQALQDLHDAGTDIITITQYLRPSPRHLPVDRWVKPEEFVEFKQEAERIGFLGVLAGPLVRSSYRAGRLWAQSMISKGRDIPEDLSHLAQDIAQEATRRFCAGGVNRAVAKSALVTDSTSPSESRFTRITSSVASGSSAYSRTANGSAPPCSSARIVMLMSCRERITSTCTSPEMSTSISSSSSPRVCCCWRMYSITSLVRSSSSETIALRAVRSIDSIEEIRLAATSRAASETSS